ncbi:patatin-like phospholipase family protein [Nocardioides sp. WL0053]|uniref:Patatin-like phospholipase family protein n=1 Tax=Nocardioides jiangsuensis TaxID=2866161 RepID=A0ABS7RLF2_9ACTN|nr:patatin-like phospholipase family protein [Nocardioides jiangsuensis]MBY9075884.1 patatin-like phospholipase family protein [Nocardioides jiangsuensis]
MAHEHSGPGTVDVDGSPEVVTGQHPLAMVYGGGGVFGIAYTAGIAAGLAAAGVPVESAPVLGTSAGAWTASAMALGLSYEDFLDVRTPSVPNLRPGVLVEIARGLFGEATHPLVAVSAVCVRTRRRHILDGGVYPLADLVAASSAVPGLLPPHRIDGRLYVDGGMWSATSVDASADADQVIVVAPIAGAVLGPMGRTAGYLLERELGHWRLRHPDRQVTMIRPNREIARLAGHNPLGLFDGARARGVYPLAFEQGLRWAERLDDRSAA